MAVYINPYTDFGFKKLFGEEANKEVLIAFLNALLPDHHQIQDLAFHNVEALPDAPDERKAFFDIHCKAVSGERFIVEMQKAKVKYFKDRSLYYITYPIREQAQRGDWNFQLNAIYFIAVLDFLYDDNLETAKFLRHVTLKDQDNDPFYDKLRLTYLQMDAFTKEAHELTTEIDKWAYFLKNLATFEDIPKFLNEPVFERAFATAKFTNLNKSQQLDYENSRLQYIGIREVSNTAKDEGIAEGIAIGEARGEQKGKAEGITIGEQKGLLLTAKIIKLYTKGFVAAAIAEQLETEVETVQAAIAEYEAE
jgi:predicted transposase/invertase (TIGR01784 family)